MQCNYLNARISGFKIHLRGDCTSAQNSSRLIVLLLLLYSILPNTTYAQTDLNCNDQFNTVSATGSARDFRIPNDLCGGEISLVAEGADGGFARIRNTVPIFGGQSTCFSNGGEGASVSGTFTVGSGPNDLPPGTILRFIVGSRGTSGNEEIGSGTSFQYGGGGGGTAVLYRKPGASSFSILLVAGGGGGAYQGMFATACVDSERGQGGRSGTSGGSGNGDIGAGAGGRNGNGGNSGGSSGVEVAGGGGGAFSDGDGVTCLGFGGLTEVGEGLRGSPNGGQGGQPEGCTGFDFSRGGFGFGGGGAGFGAAGGGGGYSGGGGGGTTGRGGGGGSFASNIIQDRSLVAGGSTSDPRNGSIRYLCRPTNCSPTAVCRNITVNLNTSGTATISAAQIDNGSFDPDGSISSRSLSRTAFGCSNIGNNTVTLTVRDNQNSSRSCNATVAVRDITAPDFVSCPSNLIIETAPGRCDAIFTYSNPVATDNCGVTVTRTAGPASGSRFPIGLTSLRFEARDASGNTDNCSFTVRVDDEESPVITCPNTVIVNSDPGSSSAVVTYSLPTATDNCSGVNVALSSGRGSGGTFPIGNHTETYRATDASGQTSDCSFTVRVNDTGAPTINCPTDVVVDNDPDQCGAIVRYNVPTFTDNVSLIPGEIPGFTLLGTFGGHSYYRSVNLALPDDAKQIAIELGGHLVTVNSQAENDFLSAAAPGRSLIGFSDRVIEGPENFIWETGEEAVYRNWANGEPNNVGNEDYTEINFTASGSWNDIRSGTSRLFIVEFDQLAVLMPNEGRGSGSFYPVGTTTLNYQATDLVGNVSTCSFTITVNDTEAPVIECPADIIAVTDPGACETTVAYEIPQITDNCTLIPEDLPGFTFLGAFGGSQYYLSNATDLAADAISESINRGGHLATVTSQEENDFLTSVLGNNNVWIGFTDRGIEGDFIWETGEAVDFTNWHPGEPNDSFDEDFGELNAEQDGVWNDQKIVTRRRWVMEFDRLGVLVPNLGLGSGSAYTVGTTTISYQATDLAGNTSTCSFDITVNDEEDPVITCPADIVVSSALGACEVVVDYDIASATDNCSGLAVSLTSGSGPGAIFPVGLSTEIYEARDAAGNTATCSFTIRVNDTEAPVLTCPPAITVGSDPGICGAVVDYSAATATDNCPDVIAILKDGLGTGSTFPVGISTETFTATDAAGNTVSCSFTVTVNDTEAPVLTCPSNTIVETAIGLCTAVVNYEDPTAVDNCNTIDNGLDIVRTTGLGTGAAFPVGTTTQIFKATDASGNETSCEFIITVEDTQAPAFLCSNDIVVSTDPGECSAVVNYVDPSGIDNCPGIVINQTIGLGSGAVFPLGVTVESFEASFSDGTMVTCTFTVTVEDTEAPVISCPEEITVSTDPGDCSAVVTYELPTATDNCSVVGIFTDNVLGSGASFPVGSTEETYEAIDSSGNVTPCTFIITVEDTEAPTISCPTDLIVSTDPGECTAVVIYDEPIATDNCSGVTTAFEEGLGIGATFPIGITTESYQATDAAGNATSCSFTVTVEDTEMPILTCPTDFEVDTSPGECAAIVSYSEPTATDNCPGVVVDFLAGLGNGVSFPLGESIESYAATDAAGNTVNCQFTVTVKDTEVPDLVCPDDMVVSTDPGLCAAVVNYEAVTATDNCTDVVPMQLAGFGSGSEFPLGTTAETFEVVDDSGNKSSCSFNITVVDGEIPVLTCPTDIAVSTDPGACSAIISYTFPTATDNCAGVTISQQEGLGPNTSFPVGSTLEVFAAQDEAGNTAVCTFTITVSDTEAPGINCPSAINVSTDPGVCGATVTYEDLVATDNCEIATFGQVKGLGSGALFPIGETIEAYEAIDATGNTTTCTFTVTINDTEAPVLTCPANIEVGTDPEKCSALVEYATPTAMDNCPEISMTQLEGLGSGSEFPIGDNLETYEVVDANGNSASCSFTVTVIDLEEPAFVCPDNIVVSTDIMECAAVVTYADPEGFDNCPGITVTQLEGLGSGSVFPLGVTTEQYEASFSDGTVENCSFTVTVNDTEDPQLTCVADIVVQNDPGSCTAFVTYEIPTATDNCPDPTVILDEGIGSGKDFPIGVTQEVYSATDASGNAVVCAFTVTVEDNENPIINCPADVEVSCDSSTDTANTGFATATDNCGEVRVEVLEEVVIPGSCEDEFTIERTFIATDQFGNTSTCTQTINKLKDDEAPVCTTCPTDATVSCNDIPALPELIITDNCDPNPTLTVEEVSTQSNDGSCSDFDYTITRTFTLLDRCGNAETLTQVLTVIDDEAPVITCPEDIRVSCSDIDLPEITGMASIMDNCDPDARLSFEDVITGGSCDLECQITRTFTAVDACGNTSSCVQQITSSSLSLIKDALNTDINGDGIADPIRIGNVRNQLIVNAENTDCLLGWLPASGDVPAVLERGAFATDEACGITSDLLDDEGHIVNPLLGEILNLSINIRLNPALGSTLLSDLDCEFAPVLNQFLRSDATVNRFLRLANLVIGNTIGPTIVDEVYAGLQCINDSYDRCSLGENQALINSSVANSLQLEQAPSTKDAVTDSKLTVFPNPTFNTVQVDLSDFEGQKGFIRVHNRLGQVLESIQLEGIESLLPIELGKYGNGFYVISLQLENREPITTSVIVIQH